jgi:RES domain-containing protein
MESAGSDTPKTIWRISNYADLEGRGGLIASGRWHTRPKPIVYCSDEPYTAYRECLRHFSNNELLLPDRHKLLKISVPSIVKFEVIERKHLDSLDASWHAPEATGWATCQNIGNRWLVSNRTALLKVPSAARRDAFNFLLNPVHPEFDGLKIEDEIEQPFPAWVTGPHLSPP